VSSSRQILAVRIITVFNQQLKVQFAKKPNQIATHGIRASQMLRDIGLIRKDIVIKKSPHYTPPWLQQRGLCVIAELLVLFIVNVTKAKYILMYAMKLLNFRILRP